MKILVALKRVVDHNVRIRVKEDGSGVETENVRHSMNPFCKHAVEAAVQIKEQNKAKEIIAISIGPIEAKDVLLNALAMGCDRAILLKTEKEQKIEPLVVAKLLKIIVQQEKPDLVFLGKQAIDDDANQTGQMLAGLLDWPQGTFSSKIELEENRVNVTREVDFGRAKISMPIPAVITADLRLNVPRKTALPMIIKAKKKPINIMEAKDFNVDLQNRLIVERISEPPKREGGKILNNVQELANIINELEAEK